MKRERLQFYEFTFTKKVKQKEATVMVASLIPLINMDSY